MSKNIEISIILKWMRCKHVTCNIIHRFNQKSLLITSRYYWNVWLNAFHKLLLRIQQIRCACVSAVRAPNESGKMDFIINQKPVGTFSAWQNPKTIRFIGLFKPYALISAPHSRTIYTFNIWFWCAHRSVANFNRFIFTQQHCHLHTIHQINWKIIWKHA